MAEQPVYPLHSPSKAYYCDYCNRRARPLVERIYHQQQVNAAKQANNREAAKRRIHNKHKKQQKNGDPSDGAKAVPSTETIDLTGDNQMEEGQIVENDAAVQEGEEIQRLDRMIDNMEVTEDTGMNMAGDRHSFDGPSRAIASRRPPLVLGHQKVMRRLIPLAARDGPAKERRSVPDIGGAKIRESFGISPISSAPLRRASRYTEVSPPAPALLGRTENQNERQ
ncbi:hypothetical protein B0H14DRAFT_3426513 [Mycena olivaceomarginata]|nr:hypothetical protein B0H14DRAFT_3426513 [Mycena olivaceomarginata]